MRKSIAITICILIFLQFCCPIVYAIDSPDYVKDIDAGHRWMLGFDLTIEYELSLEFEVVEGANKDIDIYLIDSENYDELIQGHDFTYIKFYSRVVSGTIFFIPEEDGEYWFIFDNTFSTFTTKKIEIKYGYSYIGVPDNGNGDGDGDGNGDSNGTPLPEDTTDSNIITILIIGGVVLLIVIVVVFAIVKKSRKSMSQQQQQQQQTIIIQKGEVMDKELRYCSSCGQEIKKEATFCEFCGKGQ